MYGLKMSRFVVGRMSLARAIEKMGNCRGVLAVVRLVDGAITKEKGKQHEEL